jgi:hypothetical protein
MLISYYNQEVGAHILEQPCGQSWIVTRPCAIGMIEDSECELLLAMRRGFGQAKHEGVAVCRNNA